MYRICCLTGCATGCVSIFLLSKYAALILVQLLKTGNSNKEGAVWFFFSSIFILSFFSFHSKFTALMGSLGEQLFKILEGILMSEQPV